MRYLNSDEFSRKRTRLRNKYVMVVVVGNYLQLN